MAHRYGPVPREFPGWEPPPASTGVCGHPAPPGHLRDPGPPTRCVPTPGSRSRWPNGCCAGSRQSIPGRGTPLTDTRTESARRGCRRAPATGTGTVRLVPRPGRVTVPHQIVPEHPVPTVCCAVGQLPVSAHQQRPQPPIVRTSIAPPYPILTVTPNGPALVATAASATETPEPLGDRVHPGLDYTRPTGNRSRCTSPTGRRPHRSRCSRTATI